MAKGMITIEFDSAEDLLRQLQFLVKGVGCCAHQQAERGGVSQKLPPEVVRTPVTSEQAQTTRMVLEQVFKPGPGTGPMAEPLPTPEPEKPAEEKPPEPIPPPVEEKAAITEQPAGKPDCPTVTPENLSTVPYEALLAFCDANPKVGIDTSKCQATFFRQLVECKIKAFLTT